MKKIFFMCEKSLLKQENPTPSSVQKKKGVKRVKIESKIKKTIFFAVGGHRGGTWHVARNQVAVEGLL